MKYHTLLAFSIASYLSASASEPKSVTRHLTVTERVSTVPLNERKQRMMDEATKFSYSCRMFRYLYGRWPATIIELKERSEGIDFSYFIDLKITRVSGDGLQISIYDGSQTFSTISRFVDFELPESEISAAQKPDYKIKTSIGP